MANDEERRRWNDPQWTTTWPDREQVTDSVTPFLFAAAAIKPGERVLDVGCGGGRTAIRAAGEVGAAGQVVGADLSEALAALARSRAAGAGAENVTVAVTDMQTQTVAGGPFDIAISQFGVMFFDDPPTAFANIRRHLRPGGRLVFACWQPIERNPWHYALALRPFMLAPAVPGPGAFSMGDATLTERVLEAAGFVDVVRTEHALVVEVPASAVFDPGQLGVIGVPADRVAEAIAAVDAHMQRFAIGDGLCALPLAFSIVRASA